uniref:Uncharacterized protein n=1 Tax=Oryza glumipatula TaxID=40148 RepID=A0A0D9Y7T8_9ORYZ
MIKTCHVYIVAGEKNEHVEENPQGYRIKRDVLADKYGDLVTLDRVADGDSNGRLPRVLIDELWFARLDN